MNENYKNISINLNFKPSSAFLIGLMVNFIDFLLWNRTQIPFTVDMLEKFLQKKNLDDIKCFKKLKAVKIAKDAYERICGVKELTKLEFTTSKSFIILFGSSIQTAKEAYKIIFPSTNSNVTPTFINETSNIKKVFLQLLQSDDLKDALESPLTVTNTFVLYERRCRNDEKISTNLFEVRNFKLNKSCKKFLINFTDSSNFEVFQEDFEELKISEHEVVVEKVEEIWFQSKIFVKGFSDLTTDNKSIWG
ncbi:unnamed protein product [Chironomus riparius]|uniref:Uncharacterized protein n=1 Tax=Chironomus riparius TaxID=315576 RepID=A0A9N9S8B4_9DIPT|nr:unnamed protein product [Chironomus riparius]